MLRNCPASCAFCEPGSPITLETCKDPVLASDGVVYERDAILHYLVLNSPMRSPMTRQPLSSKVVAAL